eukprot:TRINITY_DN4997_c0_g5_i1.p3 TRINITY_DN4997_c0_g5~~TRINITY_DN4997_c0_g5_i1.p3  ORF type:complete len:140 (-),score=11.18 TRINITY_DN4997_c0_g5_i1:761-1180(-)
MLGGGRQVNRGQEDFVRIQHKPVQTSFQGKQPFLQSATFKIMLVLIDCAFIGVQPILVQKSKNSQGTYSYQPVAVNFITEMVKMGISLAFIAGEVLDGTKGLDRGVEAGREEQRRVESNVQSQGARRRRLQLWRRSWRL